MRDGEYALLCIALAPNIEQTTAHFHRGLDEIYFMLDGRLTLCLYDPASEKIWNETLGPNELCVITKGIHHKVVGSSKPNRLCVICVLPFDPDDEHMSEKI